MSEFPPGLLLIVGGLVASFLPRGWRSISLLALPVVSLVHMLLAIPLGTVSELQWFDLELTPLRADGLSLVWGSIFHLAAFLSVLYGLHERDRWVASLGIVYAGAAIASVFAGDLLTLFLFWELTAISSVFLVWGGRTRQSYRAGMRYLIIQVGSGVLLLAGAIIQLNVHGSLRFGGPADVGVFLPQGMDLASWLLLLAFGIKAAFPLLHAWLPDAYPEASPAGTVFLSAFTTKLAIYTLVRGFAGYEPLIAIGCVMAVVPLIYAVAEDDVRRSLAYCLNNQLGFMVVAVGVGSELAINGAAAHAVAHILYKGLLFMATGAVLYRTTTAKASQLGGLASRMPVTFGCYLVGVAAISAPLFSGFVTKSLSLSAVAEAHHQVAWITLLVATAGVFFVCGPRLTTDMFLGPIRSPVQHELPWNMKVAMISTAVCCGLIGLFPSIVYQRLPYAVSYHAYTLPHIVEQLQLMGFAGLAFLGLVRLKVYPFSRPGILLDVDWFYRRLLPDLVRAIRSGWRADVLKLQPRVTAACETAWRWLGLQLADDGRHGRFAATGRMAMAAAIMLVIYLVVYYR